MVWGMETAGMRSQAVEETQLMVADIRKRSREQERTTVRLESRKSLRYQQQQDRLAESRTLSGLPDAHVSTVEDIGSLN